MSPQEHRVAFMMPVYQAQQDFDDTMVSLAQSTLPCTVFVVDDGSQPPLQVADYGPNLDVKLLRLPHNQGIVAAMNIGLQAALDAGFEFIARIDAGDYARPDRLARQIEYLENHPLCMLVGSDAEVRDQAGRWCFNLQPPRDPATLAKALHERAWLLHPSVMYRASVFHEIGLYSDEFTAAEDYEMFLRIASRYEVGVVPVPLIIYVTRNAGISGRKAYTQAVNRLRIQVRYFQWANWVSYYGAIRTLGTLLLPRNMKTILKLKFLYGQINRASASLAESGPRLDALQSTELRPKFRENQQQPSPKAAME
jgi:glycosyltransferase involved in cell wall biosynthesis